MTWVLYCSDDSACDSCDSSDDGSDDDAMMRAVKEMVVPPSVETGIAAAVEPVEAAAATEWRLQWSQWRRWRPRRQNSG